LGRRAKPEAATALPSAVTRRHRQLLSEEQAALFKTMPMAKLVLNSKVPAGHGVQLGAQLPARRSQADARGPPRRARNTVLGLLPPTSPPLPVRSACRS
jgi:hypothetical protein